MMEFCHTNVVLPVPVSYSTLRSVYSRRSLEVEQLWTAEWTVWSPAPDLERHYKPMLNIWSCHHQRV